MRLSPLRSPSAPAGTAKTLALLLSLPLVILCCASAARADPVVITGGSLVTGRPGNFGGTLTAPGFFYSGADLSGPKPQLCNRCLPGEAFPTEISAHLRSGSRFVYNGLTYDNSTGPFAVMSGGGVITIPAFNIPLDLSPVSTTFTFVGGVFVTPRVGAPFSVQLVGSGTVTFTFSFNGFGSNLGTTHFNFADPAQVPEPATVLLLGTGLAGVIAGARKRRKG